MCSRTAVVVLRSVALFLLAALAETAGPSGKHFGRTLVAYGGVFVAGSPAWGMAVDGFRPDRLDHLGAAVRLVGVGLIMYAPR